MTRISFSEQFWRDFDAIIAKLAYVAGEPVARKYNLDIRRSIRQLADTPGIGAPRGELGRGIRMLIVSPYLNFYDGAQRPRQ